MKELPADQRDKLTTIRMVAEAIAGEIDNRLQAPWRSTHKLDSALHEWLCEKTDQMNALLRDLDLGGFRNDPPDIDIRPLSFDHVKQTLKSMDSVCRSFAKYGAQDTEPDYVIQERIMRALSGQQGNLWEVDAEALQLYTSSMNCTAAANEISKALKNVIEAIRSCTIADMEKVGERVRAYCWRLS